MNVYGYIRLSKADRPRENESPEDVERRQKSSLVAQREAIARAVAMNGDTLVHVYEDAGKTGAHTRREGFQEVLRTIRRGDMLMIAKFDRLSRDLGTLDELVKRAERRGWFLSILDQRIDTSTAAGWLSAMIQAVFAEYERRLISERTRDALQIVKRTRQLGKPSPITPATARRIHKLRAGGNSVRQIATALSEQGIPTPGGGDWHQSVVSAFLRREAKEQEVH